MNYASINLLYTKRLNHNLIDIFVKIFSSSSRYMQKKKLSKPVNLKGLKNKNRQKKHISNPSTNPK